MDEIIRIKDLELIKFLCDLGINVYHGNKRYKVVKDAFGRYLTYCEDTEFSGGKIELYDEQIKEGKFFIQFMEIDKNTLDTVVASFPKESYSLEDLNDMSDYATLTTAYWNRLGATVNGALIDFLQDYTEGRIENDKFFFKRI